MLSDKNKFLHPVAINRVPVTGKSRILNHHNGKLVLRHRGIPQARILHGNLLSSLFKKIALVIIRVKITDSLGPDYTLRPMLRHKIVKLIDIERPTVIIHICAYAILFSLPFPIVMMVMMVVAVVVIVVVVVMMVEFVVIFVKLVSVMFIVIIVVVVSLFDLLYPGCRAGNMLIVKQARIEQLVKFNIAVITLKYLCFRLQGMNDAAYATEFRGRNH